MGQLTRRSYTRYERNYLMNFTDRSINVTSYFTKNYNLIKKNAGTRKARTIKVCGAQQLKKNTQKI